MMNVIPFVHEGFGNSSYLVQVGEGEAALIDPDRSVDRYLEAAQSQAWSIVSVLETHVHADFISGALEASHATGAQVCLPEGSDARFPHSPLKPGQRMQLKEATVEPIPSPGHTPEHMSYLFRVEGQAPVLFSGGSLIVGGAARTDLISPDMTEHLTRAQYQTVKKAFSLYLDFGMGQSLYLGGSGCGRPVSPWSWKTVRKRGSPHPFRIEPEQLPGPTEPASFKDGPVIRRRCSWSKNRST